MKEHFKNSQITIEVAAKAVAYALGGSAARNVIAYRWLSADNYSIEERSGDFMVEVVLLENGLVRVYSNNGDKQKYRRLRKYLKELLGRDNRLRTERQKAYETRRQADRRWRLLYKRKRGQ